MIGVALEKGFKELNGAINVVFLKEWKLEFYQPPIIDAFRLKAAAGFQYNVNSLQSGCAVEKIAGIKARQVEVEQFLPKWEGFASPTQQH